MLKIISIIDGVFSIKEVQAEISYRPVLKYKINKPFALDSTISIKRLPYHEDVIDVTSILSSSEWKELYDILNSPAGNGLEGSIFFLEFLYNNQIKQLQAEVDTLPPMSDYQRYGNAQVKYSFISKYITYTPIDLTAVFGYGTNYGAKYGF